MLVSIGLSNYVSTFLCMLRIRNFFFYRKSLGKSFKYACCHKDAQMQKYCILNLQNKFGFVLTGSKIDFRQVV
jgi:hypothetical protein